MNWLCSKDPIGYVDGPNLYNAHFVPDCLDPSGTELGGILITLFNGELGRQRDLNQQIRRSQERIFGDDPSKLSQNFRRIQTNGAEDAAHITGALIELEAEATTSIVGGALTTRRARDYIDDLVASFKRSQGHLPRCVADQAQKPTPGIWHQFPPFRSKTKTNGLRGKDRRYFERDLTHGDIEVYDSNGRHLGSIDATTGKPTKPPVKGRRIEI